MDDFTVLSQRSPSFESPEFVYDFLDPESDAENLENYKPGGYHPTHIGDKFSDDRYEIVHKLGAGSYSTVWLAKDHLLGKFVALKLLTADNFEKSTEEQVLRVLDSGDRDHPGRAYVQSLLDEFVVDGPNGRHRCIVTEAVGCSIAVSKSASETGLFPVNVAKCMAAQVTLALDYIHSCGLIHGDLHYQNILLRSTLFEAASVEELYNSIGKPEMLPVQRLDGNPTGPEAPRYCVEPASYFVRCEEVIDPRILIIDFGEASFQSQPKKELNTALLWSAPESSFDEPLGPSVDIWSLACTFFDILGKETLFDHYTLCPDQLIFEMIDCLGSLPQRWWDKWEGKSHYYLEDGSLKPVETPEYTWTNCDPDSLELGPRRLDRRLRNMGRGRELDQEEMSILENFLHTMLVYEPSERITASAAAKSEWMKKYGLPAAGIELSKENEADVKTNQNTEIEEKTITKTDSTVKPDRKIRKNKNVTGAIWDSTTRIAKVVGKDVSGAVRGVWKHCFANSRK